jgi:hypothetical protein
VANTRDRERESAWSNRRTPSRRFRLGRLFRLLQFRWRISRSLALGGLAGVGSATMRTVIRRRRGHAVAPPRRSGQVECRARTCAIRPLNARFAGPTEWERRSLRKGYRSMLRINALVAAAGLAIGAAGCAQCDKCDDFPVPCIGPNCGGYVPGAGAMMYGAGAPTTGSSAPSSAPSPAGPASLGPANDAAAAPPSAPLTNPAAGDTTPPRPGEPSGLPRSEL